MKKTILFLVMAVALTTQTLFAQSISSFSSQWYNTYSNGISQNGIGVFTRGIIDNGNLVVAGSSWPSWPGGTTDQLITKVSNNGSIIFQTLRAPGGDHDGFGSTCVLDNGNYAFFGQQNAQGTQYFDGFYCVFNSNGVEQSYNFFSIPGSSSGSDMKKLPNGNLVFTGNHGGGNNYIALTSQNFLQIQYQTFNVSNNGWNSGYLAVDEVNNYIFAIAGETDTNILQIKKYDFNLNLISSFTINESNPFKCYDVIVVNGSLWLCGYEIISNNRFAKVIKLDSNGIITDSNTLNSTSEYTAIINYSGNILLSKSNLTGTSSTSNELSSYLGGNIFGPSISLNSGSPFVPYDLVIDQNYVYCIGVQGVNHYVGIPAIQKLKIESDNSYTDTCNNVSGSLTQGLVGYWPFCGNANDDSGNGNNGTVNGATLTTDRFGNSNSAYDFNGLNNLIRIPHQNSLNLIGDYSISVWYKGNYQNIFNNNWVFIAKRDDNGTCCSPNVPYGVFIPFNSTNFAVPTMQYANGNYTFSTPPNTSPILLDQWQNLIITNTSDLLKFHINGELIFSENISSTLRAPNTADLLIGSVNRELGAEWMNGKLDDIGIWNRALTQEEITNLYNVNQCITNITVTDTLIINVGQLSFNDPVTWANNITIAPNPASSQININFNNITNLNGGTLKIINSLGQEVATTPITTSGTNSTMQLATWGGTGMYFVQIINPQGQIVDIKKIILQ